jgi:hypothetical protein
VPLWFLACACTCAGARAGDELIEAVDGRLEAWLPQPAERRIDRVAWERDLLSALAAGRSSRRPILVFTHDGRMGTGRQ